MSSKSKTALHNEINSQIFENTSELITATQVNGILNDIVDSTPNNIDNPSPYILTGNTSIIPLSGNNANSGTYSVISGGLNNTSSGLYSVISGGENNVSTGFGNFVGAGRNNLAIGSCYSVVVGGALNCASSGYAAVLGGEFNYAISGYTFIGSGIFNTASNKFSSVVGGAQNTASGYLSFIAGGSGNTTNATNTFILGSNISANTPNVTYANALSATTYYNLPTDIRVTGGTYTAGTATFINNTGGTFTVNGFFTGGTNTPTDTVFIDQDTPTTSGVTFDPNNPQQLDTLYVSETNSSTWIWNGSSYITYSATSATNTTEFYIKGTTTDAGSNKTSSIWRPGTLAIGSGTSSSSIFKLSVYDKNKNLSLNVNDSGDVYNSKNNDVSSIAFGLNALSGQTSTGSSFNTAVGRNTLRFTTTGIGNTGLGTETLKNLVTGYYNTGVGFNALVATTGSSNTSIGNKSFFNLINGNNNVGVGDFTANNLTTGDFNIFIGSNTGKGLVTGNYNTIIGAQISGLTSTLNNSLILSDGQGNVKLSADSSNHLFIPTSPQTGSGSDLILVRGSNGEIKQINQVTDIYTTGLTFNNSTYILTGTRNDGNSYTANLAILSSDVTITGGTYNNNTGIATFTNNSGASFTVSGFLTGMTDTYVTGFTYNNANTFTITNSTGGTLSVIANTFTGITATTISATTYQNLPIDVTITGGTYTAGTATFRNNTGGTFTVTGIQSKEYLNYVVDGSGGFITTGNTRYGISSGLAGNITGWSIVAIGTNPTCTIDIWKKVSGTTLPTITNTILSSGLQLTTGNIINSSSLANFSATTVNSYDDLAFTISAVSGATYLGFKLEITH